MISVSMLDPRNAQPALDELLLGSGKSPVSTSPGLRKLAGIR
jgi:hypothetical protein